MRSTPLRPAASLWPTAASLPWQFCKASVMCMDIASGLCAHPTTPSTTRPCFMPVLATMLPLWLQTFYDALPCPFQTGLWFVVSSLALRARAVYRQETLRPNKTCSSCAHGSKCITVAVSAAVAGTPTMFGMHSFLALHAQLLGAAGHGAGAWLGHHLYCRFSPVPSSFVSGPHAA